MKTRTLLPGLAILLCLFITSGCNSQSEEKNFTEKKLVIASKETVTIKELGLSITNNGCGREWISDDDKHSFERAYCDIIITRKGSTYTAGRDFKPIYIGDLSITVERMNPWGREEDSVPPGGCRLWVKRIQRR